MNARARWASWDEPYALGADGGVAVDECQRALGGGGRVFAAGDAAASCRSDDPSHHWFQMRLWGQVGCEEDRNREAEHSLDR